MPTGPRSATTSARELEVAIDAARRAGRLQMERYEKLERIVHKSERDVVTEVDHLSEDLIIGAIREAFPTDSYLAEESGHTAGHADAAATAAASAGESAAESVDKSVGRVWVIDPLDGTINYANGIPFFCTAIGLSVDGVASVGVVYDPTRDEMFSAVAGEGATLNGRPIRLPVKERLVDCVASMSLPRRRWLLSDRGARVRRSIRVSRSMGSAALALTYLANGRFDLFIQSGGMSAWDVCAAGVIAAEGGARLTTLDGGPWFDINRPTKTIGMLGAAPVHHKTLLELLS